MSTNQKMTTDAACEAVAPDDFPGDAAIFSLGATAAE